MLNLLLYPLTGVTDMALAVASGRSHRYGTGCSEWAEMPKPSCFVAQRRPFASTENTENVEKYETTDAACDAAWTTACNGSYGTFLSCMMAAADHIEMLKADGRCITPISTTKRPQHTRMRKCEKIHRHTQIYRHTDRHKQTHRHTDTQTHRHTDT